MHPLLKQKMNQVRGEDEQDHEASLLAMNLSTWAVPAYVLKAILELDVLEIIKRAGPQAQLSPAQIAAQLPTVNSDGAAVALGRMLSLLASFSVLTFSVRARPNGDTEEVYGLGPVCKFLTKDENGGCFAPFSLFIHDKVLTDALNNLKDVVLEGVVPFNQVHGMNIFDYVAKDQRFQDLFYDGMKSHTGTVLKKILETYKGFEGLSSLVDVGGGYGVAIKMIVSKYPLIKGINFDLPNIVQHAPSYPGVEHFGGDMYISIPTADAIFMKWTFHTGTDEQCIRLLKNCHKALPDNGKVIICEYVKPEKPETSNLAKMAFVLDNLMLAVPGGKERTKHEYEALGKQAGFEALKLVCNVCDSWIMELLKKN